MRGCGHLSWASIPSVAVYGTFLVSLLMAKQGNISEESRLIFDITFFIFTKLL